jgi:hypothetical protein
MTVSEFAAWLGGMTNKQHRRFQEHTRHTITSYAVAARTPDRSMTAGSEYPQQAEADSVLPTGPAAPSRAAANLPRRRIAAQQLLAHRPDEQHGATIVPIPR